MRSPRAFMVLSLAGLATIVALASWYDRKIALQAAEDRVQSTVGLMREHALNVFQTQELVYEQIRLRMAGLDWDAISRSEELASFLQEARNRMNQISSIWLADSTGHVRASSGLPYPRSLTFENRDDFRAHREDDHGMLVGEQHLGRPLPSASCVARWFSEGPDLERAELIRMCPGVDSFGKTDLR